jgi:outer membrane protein TolC
MAGTCIVALAQTDTSTKTRELSLDDCVQMALKENLDLQVERLDATISLYTLNGAYSAYDPSLSVSGQHNYNEEGSKLLSGGFIIPGAISDANAFTAGVTGLLPLGTTYNLEANINDTYGDSFSRNTNGAIIPLPFENTAGSVSINLAQPLLKNFWIDAPRYNIRVAKNRLTYSAQTLRMQIMQTITKLEQAYYDLIYDRTNVGVQVQALEAAERQVSENRKKVEVGTLAELDLLSAESQAEASKAAVTAARSTLAVQEDTIKQLVTSKYSAWAETTVTPSGELTAARAFFSLQDSWSKGLTQRPEMIQAKLDLEKSGIQLKFDKNQLYPELDLIGSFGYNGTGKEFSGALYDIQQQNRSFYTYGGKITLPLGNIGARNIYRSDKVLMEEAVFKVKKMERDIMFAIETDIKQAQSTFDQVGSTAAARDFAKADWEAEKKKLESGKSTPYTVLQKLRDYTIANGNAIQALANYNKNLSQLSLDEGTTLDRFGIKVEVK